MSLPKTILISEIVRDAGTQTRMSISDETVAEYAERMAAGDKFPPVTVFHDSTRYILANGFHRVYAAQRNGSKEIEALIFQGTLTDALKHALSANISNGLRRTNADKRKCVELALKNFSDLSDRGIAELCGVQHNLVRGLRPRQVDESSTSAPPVAPVQLNGKSAVIAAITPEIRPVAIAVPERRTGQDGKSYPVRPAWNSTILTDEQAKDAGERGLKDSPNLFAIKTAWRSANKQEKAAFVKWLQESGYKTTSK